jgi:diguanylate cyclase (GGDEF)-like protein
MLYPFIKNKTYKILKNILIFLVCIFLLIFWYFLVINFEIIYSILFFMLFILTVSFFSYKKYIKKIFLIIISLIFILKILILTKKNLFLFLNLNLINKQNSIYFYNLNNSQQKLFIIIHILILLTISLLYYFIVLKNSTKINNLNKNISYLTMIYDDSMSEKNLIKNKMDIYRYNINIMAEIYKSSRKLIKMNNFHEHLEASKEFINKIIKEINSEYCIFNFDIKKQNFNIIFKTENITNEIIAKFKILFIRNILNLIVNNNNEVYTNHLLINKESKDWNLFAYFLPIKTIAIILIPTQNFDNFLSIIVLFINDEKYLSLNLNYLNIFSKQMLMSSKKIKIYEEVQKQIITDSLTGLYNRHFINDRFLYEMKKYNRENKEFSFIIIDIDFFKHYNDTYGHLVGDSILKQCAKLLKELFYETDFVARYGGEEFVILMPGTSVSLALKKAEKVRKIIENTPFYTYDDILINERITISVGISSFPDSGKDLNSIFEKADTALYYAKNNGRNMVVNSLDI